MFGNDKTGIMTTTLSIMAMFISGIFFSILYFVLATTETAFKNTSCVIHNNIYVSTCQGLWNLSLYPFFALKDILVWFSFFFIFALVLGMLIAGYKAGKSPVMMGLLFIFTIVLTYIGIIISNVYRSMLDMELFRQMMVNFVIYNNVMLYLPWFTFIVGIASFMLSVVNYQRANTNKVSDFNY